MKGFIRKRLKLLVVTLLIVAVGFGGYFMIWGKKATAAAKLQEYTVKRKNIDVVVSGTGTVTSATRQDLTAKVPGTVTKVYYNEGDKVKAGDVLFQLDDTNAANQVKMTQLSIEQSQNQINIDNENISDLNVTTPISGQVSNILVSVGDDVNKGQTICTVTDTSDLKLTVPFNGSQIKNIYVGESADVFLQDYMDTVPGTVTYISNAGKAVAGGGTLYNVDISINNPGSVTAGATASAEIGGQYSINSGNLQYTASRKIMAQVSGTVQSINVNDQQAVSRGQSIVILTNDDLQTALTNDEFKLDNLKAQLDSNFQTQDNYKIYTPIDGTIINQPTKVGDVFKDTNSTVAATISNPDEMQFNIPVDELDIAKIAVGMKAAVTIDALPNQKFDGVVSKIVAIGTTSNGVTTYPVTISILNPVGVREGMNANADIQVIHKDNVLTLPINAVQKIKDRYYVFVKSASGAASKESSNWSGQKFLQQSNGGMSSESKQWQSSSSGTGQKQNASGNMNSKQTFMLKTLGSGISIKMVQVGVNNDSDIEIVSGLNEGDTVVVPVTQSSSSGSQQKSVMPFGGGGGGGVVYRSSDGDSHGG